VLERIRRALHGPKIAYLMPYNSTRLERDVALALDIPLFGADPGHAWFGTKSGSRSLFATAGVPHPLGAEHIRTIADAVEAICLLRARKPELAEGVIKLDHAVSGEGNAIVDLAGLPVSGTLGEGELIRRRLERLVPDVERVSSAAYLRKLASQGGVVEERIIGRDLRSPSVQVEITPAGAVRLLSTHDQILHGRSGQQFAGCRFPADRAYAPVISALAQRVGEHLALVGLTGSSYDPQTASFTTRQGRPRHYVATDHLEIPHLPALGQAGLLARGTHEDLRFDQDRGRGVVFHMLSSIDSLATIGVTAIADAPDTADHLYAHVGRVLARAAGERAVRDRPVPIRAALGAPGYAHTRAG
jgi:PGM1 C-terminal domain